MNSVDLSPQDLKDLFAETRAQFAETRAQFAEADKRFHQDKAEYDRRMSATDKRLNKLQLLFESQWGKLVESLIEGDLLNLLKQRDINVDKTMCRVTGDGYEFDIIAVNGNEVVVVEVKSSLRPEHIRHFQEKLSHVKEWIREFEDKTIYGAMAWLRDEGQASQFAQKQGLFSIRATGNSSMIVNNKAFKPVAF